jgi:hypothetical protein
LALVESDALGRSCTKIAQNLPIDYFGASTSAASALQAADEFVCAISGSLGRY